MTGMLPPKAERHVHVMSCGDCRADLDVRDHYPDCEATPCTCPPHIDGVGRDKWPDCPVHSLRDITKGDTA